MKCTSQTYIFKYGNITFWMWSPLNNTGDSTRTYVGISFNNLRWTKCGLNMFNVWITSSQQQWKSFLNTSPPAPVVIHVESRRACRLRRKKCNSESEVLVISPPPVPPLSHRSWSLVDRSLTGGVGRAGLIPYQGLQHGGPTWYELTTQALVAAEGNQAEPTDMRGEPSHIFFKFRYEEMSGRNWWEAVEGY